MCSSVFVDPICNMMVLQGPCKKYEMNYAYDDNTGQCRLFLYGGCLGNQNRFPTFKRLPKKMWALKPGNLASTTCYSFLEKTLQITNYTVQSH
ncbi:hypothetical protein CEXT_237361 [Caerostris extrusa]|uniref:BPTI/Kunitz inhibitor domain-containing protein n=1 Tax=Caerostris extrusa TaxID=172846 RepID=A0AAV4WGY3_CAEEX|nr:hypothetical protein CEXT_237361 [Caerostris extrusa]